jgi:hypothetical protein
MSHSSSRDTNLDSEAERIYRAIFRDRPPDIVKRRFMKASALLNERSDKEEVDRYYKAISAVKDLEALEAACRYTRKLPLLSKKFQIMVYIAETTPKNQRFFVNRRTSRLRGWWSFAGGGFQTLFKIGKGLLLLAKVKHA